MKLLHLGDLHLGRSLGEFDLIRDQEYILDQVLDIIRSREIDAVLIAGDVYDKAIPSEGAVNLLDEFIKKLSDAKVQTYIISGNHDSDDRLNFGSSLFEDKGIYISSRFDGKMRKYVTSDEMGEVNIYLLPFVKASQVKHFYPDEKIETYEDAVRVIIDNSGVDYSSRNVLVAHQFVAGNEDPQVAGSEAVGVQNVGLVEKIGYSVMEQFDYAALGHIHSPQRIGADHIRYSGSPLKYSLSEVNNDKSVPVITLGKKGSIDIELVPLKPMRDLRHIRGTRKQLLDRANVTDTEDFIYVTLTEEDIVNDAIGIFRATYPNTIKLDYDNSRTREMEQVDLGTAAPDRKFSELISDFYSQVFGCDITDSERQVMMEVALEAGAIEESEYLQYEEEFGQGKEMDEDETN
ncbi:exonuclease SbcCD subunit D [Butyrivibrio sp. AE3009]|uniref:exonuclease SbcCD subunit D n=1 Tax=Butyrivibrio sp. AE3009 TaxID=1280666 RepID=UPI0003B4FB3F|nr:exonuclease SbcCD subunit D [Butyrivibrio sp. AE3009]